MDWYRWTEKSEAEACLNEINSHSSLPITGRNALTKEPAPDKQKTERWFAKVRECTDGKYGFPALTDKWLSMTKMKKSDKDNLEANHSATTEKFDAEWIPPENEGVVE